MLEDTDPLSLNAYLRNRMREFFGLADTDALALALAEPTRLSRLDRPRGAALPERILEEALLGTEPWSFFSPERGATRLLEPVAEVKPEAPHAGHVKHPSGQVEILDGPATSLSRPPRRQFRLDVTESDDCYWLRADLAGMRKEHVKISVDDAKKMVFVVVEPPRDAFFGLYKSPLESEKLKGDEKERAVAVEEAPATSEDEKRPPVAGQPPYTACAATATAVPESQIPKKEICHLVERCIHPMARHIKMPAAVDFSAPVLAEMREGLLVMRFEKAKAAKEEASHRRHVDIR